MRLDRCATTAPASAAGREEAIFEKFTRGEPSRDHPGVGLGLAICRAIVEAHGGRIGRPTRADGGGAKFIFTLPPANAAGARRSR